MTKKLLFSFDTIANKCTIALAIYIGSILVVMLRLH